MHIITLHDAESCTIDNDCTQLERSCASVLTRIVLLTDMATLVIEYMGRTLMGFYAMMST